MINLSSYPTIQIVLVVLVSMFFFFRLGHWFFRWRKIRMEELEKSGFGAVEGSLLGLLALMLAFTFSLASSHYDRRIQVINQEANDIGTAILRSDLYPDSIRRAFRADFKQYLETRVAFAEAGLDLKKALASLEASAAWQEKLWRRAARHSQQPELLVASNQMIPALNAMFDIVTTRNIAMKAKVPDIIFYTLFALCLTAAFTVGYTVRHVADWPIKLGFALMTALTLYLAMDLDRARRGVITVGFVQQSITDLRTMFADGE